MFALAAASFPPALPVSSESLAFVSSHPRTGRAQRDRQPRGGEQQVVVSESHPSRESGDMCVCGAGTTKPSVKSICALVHAYWLDCIPQ